MTEAKAFLPVKLICGIIAAEQDVFEAAEERMVRAYGELEHRSELFVFDFTDYYAKQMGEGLRRRFLSFVPLISPERLGEIKLETNAMEESMRIDAGSIRRLINLDPGYLTASALIMATAKDFAHRIPLQKGIYAHLEFLFGRKDIRLLEWTYPDFRTSGYQAFFQRVRLNYLQQLRDIGLDGSSQS